MARRRFILQYNLCGPRRSSSARPLSMKASQIFARSVTPMYLLCEVYAGDNMNIDRMRYDLYNLVLLYPCAAYKSLSNTLVCAVATGSVPLVQMIGAADFRAHAAVPPVLHAPPPPAPPRKPRGAAFHALY